MARSERSAAPPEGLVYRPHLLSAGEEQELVGAFGEFGFAEIRMHGVVARRTAAHFGWDYDYERWSTVPGRPLPDQLVPLRERCAELAGVPPDALAEALVQRYPPGAGIGWHRDSPPFGLVVGVSLGSACRMRFRRGRPGAWTTFDLRLEPRSAYVLADAARSSWQHSIPSTEALRFSVNFRTFRRPAPV